MGVTGGGRTVRLLDEDEGSCHAGGNEDDLPQRVRVRPAAVQSRNEVGHCHVEKARRRKDETVRQE